MKNLDIPKNAAWRCAKCKKQIPYTLTCQKHKNGIPKEILSGKKICGERIPKE